MSVLFSQLWANNKSLISPRDKTIKNCIVFFEIMDLNDYSCHVLYDTLENLRAIMMNIYLVK